MSMIIFDHGGQELLDSPEMGENVDLEGATNGLLWLTEDCSVVSYPGIIDQNGRVAVIFADHICDGLEIVPRRDIGLVEEDARG